MTVAAVVTVWDLTKLCCEILFFVLDFFCALLNCNYSSCKCSGEIVISFTYVSSVKEINIPATHIPSYCKF